MTDSTTSSNRGLVSARNTAGPTHIGVSCLTLPCGNEKSNHWLWI